MNLAAQRVVFRATSRLTEIAPVWGARLLDSTLRPVLGSRALGALLARGTRSALRRTRGLRRFLVVPDIHIGDAVMTESALGAVRDFFPDAEIDYAVNRTVAPIIEGHPDATRVLPIFSGAQFPVAADVEGLSEVIRTGAYDLVLSFGPYMDVEQVAPRAQPFVSFMTHAPTLVRNESDRSQVNHFSWQYYQFVREILGTVARPERGGAYPRSRTTLSEEAIGGAARFAREAGLAGRSGVVMVNPDGACRYNVLPFEDQAALLALLAQRTAPDVAILLGAGHSQRGIGERLLRAMPAPLAARVRIIPPALPLDAYVALIDYADVFITGDTGPLHLAAARRHARSGRHRFRNRTAVLSLFGATMSRMSGYDSTRPGYLAANQDAPSWCYVAPSRCRNITCLNKYFKTCGTVRCFERTDAAGLADLVASHLRGVAAPGSVEAGPLRAGVPVMLEPAAV